VRAMKFMVLTLTQHPGTHKLPSSLGEMRFLIENEAIILHTKYIVENLSHNLLFY
jgi:hypothetical protein